MAEALVHPFERAGLGKAPFRFVGTTRETYQAFPGAPVQAGGSCDYCGNAISDMFWVRGADGSKFKVGCDCIFRIAPKGSALLTETQKAAKKLDREKRHAREDAKISEGKAWIETHRDALAAIPHPDPIRAKRGETTLTMVEWYLRNAGTAGKLRIIAAARGAIAQAA